MDGKCTACCTSPRSPSHTRHAEDDSAPSTPSRTSLDDDHFGNRPLLADSAATPDNVDARDLYQHGGSGGQGSSRNKWQPEDRRGQGQDDGDDYQAPSSRSHFEHNLTVREAIKAYPMAIFWSLAVSMCVIMEGFDSILVPNFYAFPTFQRKCTSELGLEPRCYTND